MLLILPILIPLAAAVIGLVFHMRVVQRLVGVVGTSSLLVAGIALLFTVQRDGIQVLNVGNWPAPFGITFVADLFSAIMVVLAGLMGLAVAVYSLVTIDRRRELFGYYSLLLILLMGVCGSFLTGDLFNLYVWFEVLLIASFVLMALGGERAQIEGAIKYVTLNLISSALFLTAVGTLYGEVGTLNMADLARRVQTTVNPGLITTLAMLFLIAFGIKAATFPLFFWLPASYHTPPIAVSAIFAGLLTKVGVYALIRVFTLLFINDVSYTHTIIMVMAALTMLSGMLGALAQNEVRRVLSFLIIGHVGFALMGLGIFTPLGLAGAIFYIIEDIVVLTALFMVSGVVRRLGGSYRLPSLGGLYAAYPGLAILFLIPGLSMSGIPPLPGFVAKLLLLRAGLESANYLIVAVALLASVMTLFAITRIWSEAFWKPRPAEGMVDGATPRRWELRIMLAPIVGLVALTVLLGILAGPIADLAMAASDQLLNTAGYIDVVLEVQR